MKIGRNAFGKVKARRRSVEEMRRYLVRAIFPGGYGFIEVKQRARTRIEARNFVLFTRLRRILQLDAASREMQQAWKRACEIELLEVTHE